MLVFGGLLSDGVEGGRGHVDVAEHLCFCMMVVKGCGPCGQDRVLLSMCVLASLVDTPSHVVWEVHFLSICSFLTSAHLTTSTGHFLFNRCTIPSTISRSYEI